MAPAGTASCCPGWITLVSVSRLAASNDRIGTPSRPAIPNSESPGRTVYAPVPAEVGGLAPAGIASRWPGWMTLVSVSPLAASNDRTGTPSRRAIPNSESPGCTVYVPVPAGGARRRSRNRQPLAGVDHAGDGETIGLQQVIERDALLAGDAEQVVAGLNDVAAITVGGAVDGGRGHQPTDAERCGGEDEQSGESCHLVDIGSTSADLQGESRTLK